MTPLPRDVPLSTQHNTATFQVHGSVPVYLYRILILRKKTPPVIFGLLHQDITQRAMCPTWVYHLDVQYSVGEESAFRYMVRPNPLLHSTNSQHHPPILRKSGNTKGRFYLLAVEHVLRLQLRQSKRVQEAGIGIEVVIVVYLSDGYVRKKLSECL